MSGCDCEQCRAARQAEMLNEVPMLMWIDEHGLHMERIKLHNAPVAYIEETE